MRSRPSPARCVCCCKRAPWHRHWCEASHSSVASCVRWRCDRSPTARCRWVDPVPQVEGRDFKRPLPPFSEVVSYLPTGKNPSRVQDKLRVRQSYLAYWIALRSFWLERLMVWCGRDASAGELLVKGVLRNCLTDCEERRGSPSQGRWLKPTARSPP